MDVIIVNYNSTAHLRGCIESLRACRGRRDVRIFVQDNASEDGEQGMLDDLKGVELTRNPSNIGFARAVNQALGQGTSPYVVLLNPDARVDDDFFEAVHRFLEEHPDVGVLGPRILDGDGAVQGSARSFPTPLTALFGRTSLLTRLFPRNPFSRGNIRTSASDGATPLEVDWVSGACMVVRRQAIRAVGELDERFFLYWEDADWCRRMGDAGWKIVYYPRVAVVHHVGGSAQTARGKALLAFHRSCYRLFYKYNDGFAFRLLKPLVISGLALRCLFVLAGSSVSGPARRRRPGADAAPGGSCGAGSSRKRYPRGPDGIRDAAVQAGARGENP